MLVLPCCHNFYDCLGPFLLALLLCRCCYGAVLCLLAIAVDSSVFLL